MSDLAAALGIVGAQRALLILEWLLDGPHRYGFARGNRRASTLGWRGSGLGYGA